MRFDLRTPCKHCPFRTDATAIRFAARSRAVEIEELAYRQGFPCHQSADLVELDDEDGNETSGYVFGDNTQHCAGALIMHTRDGDGPVPFQQLDEAQQDAILERLDYSAPVFEDEEAFFAANTKEGDDDDDD